MQLEKNKSRWLRRWWLETIGSAAQDQHSQASHAEKENNLHKNESNIQTTSGLIINGGYGGIKPSADRITFARTDTPKRPKQISPKQQLSEALHGYRARVQAELMSRKMEVSPTYPTSPSRSNKRPRPANTSDSDSDPHDDTFADERPRKKIKRQTTPRASSPAHQEGEQPSLKANVQKVLATAGVSPDSIIRLINNEEDRTEIIKQTGFSNNYIMKLQRKVLRSAAGLQLRNPDVHQIGEAEVHVLFDSNNTALFIKKELCELLSMKGTTFSYWKKKSNVEELDTSQDFRLMDQCRSIFGGRSTYTLYTVDATLAILTRMESSRQKGIFRATALQQLIKIAQSYIESGSTSSEEEEEEDADVKMEQVEDFLLPQKAVVAVKSEQAATPAIC